MRHENPQRSERRLRKLYRDGERSLDALPDIKAILDQPESGEDDILKVRAALRSHPALAMTAQLSRWIGRNRQRIIALLGDSHVDLR